MKDSAMWAQVNQRWSAFSLIFFYNAGSVGVQGATRLKPCNFGHLPRYLRSVYVQYTSFICLANDRNFYG